MRALPLPQNWVTYSAGYNTTLAMIVDNQVNGPYSLAVHNGQSLPALMRACGGHAYSRDTRQLVLCKLTQLLVFTLRRRGCC